MNTRALLIAAVVCSTALFVTACPAQDDGDIIAKLTVSKSGALVNDKGRILRAKENRRYAGHTLQLLNLGDNERLERLVNEDGEVVRERRCEAEEANTATQESATGDDCTVFTDDAGNEVANSCAVPDADADDVRCERVDTFSDDGEALICALCYDASGAVVTRECHPAEPGDPTEPCASDDQNCLPPEPHPCDANTADCQPPPTCDSTNDPDCLPPPTHECFVVHQGDMTCRVCTTASGETFEECYQDPDPIRCELLQTDDGLLCTYCFDAAGEVVERSCVPNCDTATGAADCPPPPPTLICEEFVTPDGSYCRVCYDEMGNAIERHCEGEPPPPTECREYHDPNGRICVLCTTADGDIVSRECTDPGCDQTGVALECAADGECPNGEPCVDGLCGCGQPPECRLFETANGYFCEICGDINNDGAIDLNDAYCFPRPQEPIACEEYETSDGLRCVVCYAPDGTVVEESCRNEPEPPRCVVQGSTDAAGTASGDVCEICYDESGNVIYNSCQNVQCWEETFEENGALIICEVCADASGEVSRFCHGGGGCDPTDPNTDCPPPPMYCEETAIDFGPYCVTCYDENGNVISETCEPQGGVCTVEERPTASGETVLCEVCFDDAGNVISERCDTTTPPPNVCEEVQTSDGQLCTICYDANGQIISDECHPMQCWTEEFVEGGQVFLCDVCATGSGELVRECHPQCTDASNCLPTSTVFIDPIQCGGNPWEQNIAGTDPANTDEILLVRAWLESLGVTSYNIRFERIYQNVCEACTCPRGDRLFIETDAEGAEILRQYGFMPM